MTRAEITQRVLDLPVDEQLDLAQTLWERASPPAAFELSPALRQMLEERLQEARRNPDAGIPWEDVKRDILHRL